MDEELMARQQPQSLEAEQAVLGSILIDSRCISDIIGILKPEDFYQEQNREIYETVYTMFNFSETIDPITILDKLKELGYYHENSLEYVKQLMEITPTAANAVRYANIVQEKAMLRGLGQAAGDITEMVYDQTGTAGEILESAEKKIYALRKGERGDSLEHIGTTMHRVFDRLNELSRSDSAIAGMSTGLRDLDTKINGRMDIRIDDNPTITVADINAKCRRLDNLGLIIIDYLQLMQGSGYGKNSENRVVVVGEISRSLKIMAKELNVPVICLSQLSRAVESRTDKRPILSDLRESGAIEQDADSVMFIYRDEYYNPNTEEPGTAECIVAKNRHGETGTVKLQWVGQYQSFADREWKHVE